MPSATPDLQLAYLLSLRWYQIILLGVTVTVSLGSDGVKDMTHEAKAKAKAKAKDLTCHAALKPQTLYTVQC